MSVGLGAGTKNGDLVICETGNAVGVLVLSTTLLMTTAPHACADLKKPLRGSSVASGHDAKLTKHHIAEECGFGCDHSRTKTSSVGKFPKTGPWHTAETDVPYAKAVEYFSNFGVVGKKKKKESAPLPSPESHSLHVAPIASYTNPLHSHG